MGSIHSKAACSVATPQAALFILFPVNSRCVRPEFFQRVVFARFRIEDVDDYVSVVLNDPLAGLVAFDGSATVADGTQGRVGFFGDGVDLAPTGAGGEDKEVIQGGDAPHVQDKHVAGLVVGGDAGGKTGTFQGGRQLGGRHASHRCEFQVTSFRYCDPPEKAKRPARQDTKTVV